MNEDMMDAIEKDNVVFLSTCSNDEPNVVPIGFARPLDDEKILLVDNYMKKTRENLEKNPRASLVIRDASKCPYQFKGSVEIITSGELFDEAVDWATSVMSKLSPKASILIKLDEIYSTTGRMLETGFFDSNFFSLSIFCLIILWIFIFGVMFKILDLCIVLNILFIVRDCVV